MNRHKEHPMQPLLRDRRRILRFKPNKIVQFLLDAGPFDMNQLARMKFSREDREQFAQLIGYSLQGFSELEYVSSSAYQRATVQGTPTKHGKKTQRSNHYRAESRDGVLRVGDGWNNNRTGRLVEITRVDPSSDLVTIKYPRSGRARTMDGCLFASTHSPADLV